MSIHNLDSLPRIRYGYSPSSYFVVWNRTGTEVWRRDIMVPHGSAGDTLYMLGKALMEMGMGVLADEKAERDRFLAASTDIPNDEIPPDVAQPDADEAEESEDE